MKLKTWWVGLAEREQHALFAGGILLAFFIFYQGIWSPLLESASTMRVRIKAEERTLARLQVVDHDISQLAQKESNQMATSPGAMLGILQKQIVEAKLEDYLQTLKQASNASIEMHFQKVEFDKLIKLLTLMFKKNNVTLSQCSIVSAGTPGIVNADILLALN